MDNSGQSGFQKMLAATITGAIPPSVLEPIADLPLARACVDGDIAKFLIDRDELSGAMLHLTQSLEILKSAIQDRELSSDYWIARVYAVCLERMGDLQLRFGRLEESI